MKDDASHILGEGGPQPTEAERAMKTVSRWHGRAVGIWLVVASLGIGVLAPVITNLVATIARKQEISGDAMGGFAAWMIANPIWSVTPAVISLCCGVSMIVSPRGKWLLLLLGTLCLAGLAIAVIGTFVLVLAPLYNPVEL